MAVFARAGKRAAMAFSRNVAGRTLTFDYRDVDQSFVDQETGSVWDAVGPALTGPRAGAELEQLDTRRAFWFSIAIAFPGIEVYTPCPDTFHCTRVASLVPNEPWRPMNLGA